MRLVAGVDGLERRRDLDEDDTAAGLLHEAGLRALDHAGGALSRRLGLGGEARAARGRRAAPGLQDEREVAVALLADPLRQDLPAVLCLGAGSAEAVAEEVAQVAGCGSAQDEDDEPGEEDLAAVGDYPSSPALHAG